MSAHSENLSAYLDGELTAAEIAELEAEFSADPSVRQERDELEAMVDFVRAHGPLEAPAGFADAVLAKVAEEAVPSGGGALVWLRRPMGIPLEALAVAAAAVFVLVFALNSGEMATTEGAARQVFEPTDAKPVAAAQPVGEAEEADDGIAQLVLPSPASPRPSPRARPKPSPKAAPAPVVAEPMVGTGDVEAIQQLGTKGLASGGGGTADGYADEQQAADPALSVVPWNYTLHAGSADVLKQLDRVARRHGGQLQTSTGEVFRPSEMTPGNARVFVFIPNTEVSAFTTELRSLGQVSNTPTQSFFPGDRVRLQIDVDYQAGATYAPSATTGEESTYGQKKKK